MLNNKTFFLILAGMLLLSSSHFTQACPPLDCPDCQYWDGDSCENEDAGEAPEGQCDGTCHTGNCSSGSCETSDDDCPGGSSGCLYCDSDDGECYEATVSSVNWCEWYEGECAVCSLTTGNCDGDNDVCTAIYTDKPICEDGTPLGDFHCVGCLDDIDCVGNSNGGICVNGVCVECEDDLDCSGNPNGEFCVNDLCVECEINGDCMENLDGLECIENECGCRGAFDCPDEDCYTCSASSDCECVAAITDVTSDDYVCIDNDITFTETGVSSSDAGCVSWSDGGTPATGSGETFTTQWSTAGSQTVTAAICEGDAQTTASKQVKVVEVVVEDSDLNPVSGTVDIVGTYIPSASLALANAKSAAETLYEKAQVLENAEDLPPEDETGGPL